MMEATLVQAAEMMQGTLHGADREFHGVSTDSRTLRAGELFFALKGPNFDGSRFIDSAAEKAAAGAVVDSAPRSELPAIVVDDTRAALGRLASAWRHRMPATVIGLTGSNGKTTLKELLARILSLAGPTLATEGNLNNEIGVPTMLLRIEHSHRFAVIEMGANHPGEIAYLAALTDADVVAITNAAPAHLEGFGSVEGVARAKGEILVNPRRPSVAVLNADDAWYAYWCSLLPDLDIVSFGTADGARVRATELEAAEDGMRFTLHLGDDVVRVALPLPGRHNVANACAAAAIAMTLQVPATVIRKGLESARPVSGRLMPREAPGGITVYDDSYNANPASVAAAAAFLAAQGADAWLVLGDMGELGPDATALHAAAGRAAKAAGVRHLLATGALSRHTVDAFGDGALWFDDVEALTAALRRELGKGGTVLVKGSRATRMERVVDALCGTGPAARTH